MLKEGLTFNNVEDYLARHQKKDLLRFLTCGSVDDGKSTLIGRLLHDSKLVYEDQLEALHRDSAKVGNAGEGVIDFALLCDGLKSEREQGITIDVAYRYFSTDKRTFIIADTPGHEQYTRNMATGASVCDLAIILIDARNGVVTQTKRHSFIVSLLGIRHVIVAINKMDLVDYSEEVFDQIREDYTSFAAKLELRDIHFVPISALRGDNIIDRSEKTPWYQASPILQHLETVHIASDRNLVDFRFVVQYVIRPDLNFRGYAGSVVSGMLRVGDEVIVLPSQRKTVVESIETMDGKLECAFAPQAVTITTADEIDLSRGEMLVHSGNIPTCSRDIEAMVVWMVEEPLDCNRQYWMRTIGGNVPCMVSQLRYKVDVNTLHRSNADTLKLNEIGCAQLSTVRPVPVDPYSRNRATGAFILIDRLTNATVAAGMIRAVNVAIEGSSKAATHADRPLVTKEERSRLLGQQGVVVWLTGLPKAGKSPVANQIERFLLDRGHAATVLDGSSLREGLSDDLDFSGEDRVEQIRRIAAVANITANAGLITIVASVSPFVDAREKARLAIGEDRFLEIYCNAPLDWCEANDDEGVYERARSGELKGLTGISAPYEEPSQPALILATHQLSFQESAQKILKLLDQKGFLKPMIPTRIEADS